LVAIDAHGLLSFYQINFQLPAQMSRNKNSAIVTDPHLSSNTFPCPMANRK
jgi:hypothetical protein